jgi:hypothetical protein
MDLKRSCGFDLFGALLQPDRPPHGWFSVMSVAAVFLFKEFVHACGALLLQV